MLTKPSPETWPSAVAAWYAVLLLTLANVVALIDRQILTLLVEPLRSDFGLTDTGISLLHGFAFALFYSIMALPIARLADNQSRRRLISIGIAAWSIMTALCGLTKTFGQLFLARVGVGIGEATLVPAANSLIGDSFPPERRSLPLGVFAAGISAGMGLGLLVGAVAVQFADGISHISWPLVGVLKPWQIVFLILGIAGLPLAVLVMTILEPVRQELGADSATSNPNQSLRESLSHLANNWRTYGTLFGGYTCFVVAANGVATWTPTFYIRSFDLTAPEAGMRMGLVVLLGGIMGALSGGAVADWLKRRKTPRSQLKILVSCGFAMLIPAALAPMMSTVTGSLAFLFFTFFFGAMTVAPTISALQEATPNRLRAQATAILYLMVNLVGVGIGPFAIAVVTDYVFHDDLALRYSLSVVAVTFTVIGATLLALALKQPHARKARSSE